MFVVHLQPPVLSLDKEIDSIFIQPSPDVIVPEGPWPL